MKGLLGALELQVGDTQFESTCLEEPTFRIQTRKVWIGTRYRKQDDMAVCFCTTCMWLTSVVGESHLVSSRDDGSWKHPGPGLSGSVLSNPFYPACRNLKQGYTRILPGVQTASSQLITKSYIEVSWAIHSTLIGENSSSILCFLLTTVVTRKARYTFGPATKHLDSIDCSI